MTSFRRDERKIDHIIFSQIKLNQNLFIKMSEANRSKQEVIFALHFNVKYDIIHHPHGNNEYTLRKGQIVTLNTDTEIT